MSSYTRSGWKACTLIRIYSETQKKRQKGQASGQTICRGKNILANTVSPSNAYINVSLFTFAFGPRLELDFVSAILTESTASRSPYKMLIEEEDAAELKTWVVKRLENMYVRIHC